MDKNIKQKSSKGKKDKKEKKPKESIIKEFKILVDRSPSPISIG